MADHSRPEPNFKRLVIIGTVMLCVPIFLVSMAFIALSSDAKNHEKYQQQRAENLARIEAKRAAEPQATEQRIATSEQLEP